MGAIGYRVEGFEHEWVMGFGDSPLSPATGALGVQIHRRRFLRARKAPPLSAVLRSFFDSILPTIESRKKKCYLIPSIPFPDASKSYKCGKQKSPQNFHTKKQTRLNLTSRNFSLVWKKKARR